MHILITGATGFVGTHLRRYLLATTDWSITGTAYPDDPPPPLDAARERLVPLDMRDATATRDLLAAAACPQLRWGPPDYVVHLAAQSHVPTAYADPWGTLENNIQGQLNLLEGCVKLGISPRILVIGSGEEYGRAMALSSAALGTLSPAALGTEELPLREEHPLRPENPYSVSKVAQDVMGYQYYASFGLPVIRMRPFNHVGPGQSPRFVLPAFASQIAAIEAGDREPVLRVGNLEPARDFTDVRDVVRAYHLALLHGQPGAVYNVASGIPRTIRSLLDGLLALSDVDIAVERDPDRYRPADVPVIYGSAAKLAQDTGWQPEIPFKQTVKDVLTEWRETTTHQGGNTS